MNGCTTHKRIAGLLALTGLALLWGGCGARQQTVQPGYEEGLGVYMSDRLHGRTTASGEPYDRHDMTAAHRYLPFGTVARVTRLDRVERTVDVRINDRGPFDDFRRVIDLSRAAAEHLEMVQEGVVPVRVEVISLPEQQGSAGDS